MTSQREPVLRSPTRRVIVVVALLVLLAVIGSGPYRTNAQLRAAREAEAAQDAARTAQLDELARRTDELVRLLGEQRALIEAAGNDGVPADQLLAINVRIADALDALRATPRPAPTPAPTSTPAPVSTSTRGRPATTPEPSRPAAPPRTPCDIRLLNVCVERTGP